MMKLEEPNWFPRREDDLPSPDDLIPLSQSLITPDLALAFDIPTTATPTPIPSPSPSPTPPPTTIPVGPSSHHHHHHHHHHHPNLDFDNPPTPTAAPSPDEQARTLKRPRLVWTPQLHKRFVDAVAHLGIKNAVPKTIMQLMSVDGLTRENVASHLQKYRLYLKRMQGLSHAPHNANSNAGPHPDAATDHLFASVPHPFLLHRSPAVLVGGGIASGVGGSAGDHHQQQQQFPPFHQQQQQQQHAAAQQYYHHPRHVTGCVGAFEHGGELASRQPGVVGRFVGVRPPPPVGGGAYGEDVGEKKVLTLFPTNED